MSPAEAHILSAITPIVLFCSFELSHINLTRNNGMRMLTV